MFHSSIIGLEGKISDQFKDLKEKLSDVTEKEWAALPDVGDRSLKYKQQRRQEIFTPLVDTMLADQAQRTGDNSATSISASTPAPGADDGLTSVVGGLASARNKVRPEGRARCAKAANCGILYHKCFLNVFYRHIYEARVHLLLLLSFFLSPPS